MFKSFHKSNNSTANEPDTSTTEDFVNISMDTDYAESVATTKETSALSVKITPKHDTIGLDAPHTSTEFCATMTARDLPEDDDFARAPVDIVVALDVSGSMSGRKLELCKDTLSLLLRELGTQDRFGLVVFGDEAKLEIPTRKLYPRSRLSILAAAQI